VDRQHGRFSGLVGAHHSCSVPTYCSLVHSFCSLHMMPACSCLLPQVCSATCTITGAVHHHSGRRCSLCRHSHLRYLFHLPGCLLSAPACPLLSLHGFLLTCRILLQVLPPGTGTWVSWGVPFWRVRLDRFLNALAGIIVYAALDALLTLLSSWFWNCRRRLPRCASAAPLGLPPPFLSAPACKTLLLPFHCLGNASLSLPPFLLVPPLLTSTFSSFIIGKAFYSF